MRAAVLVLCAACATQAAAPPPVCPAVVAPTVEHAPALDDAKLVAMSHDFFDAIDRADLAAFRDALAPAFFLFEDERFSDPGVLGSWLQSRLDRHAAVRSRTWSDEHVYRGDGAAIFVGRATEHIPAEQGNAAAEQDGYNTLVWIPVGTIWKVAHWQWSRAGIEAERERWNETLTQGTAFNHEPNKLLVETVQGRKPGSALDLLMGQGRNAIFLASQGWKVTGVDIADQGLKLAQEEAARRKLKLDTVEADVDKYDLGKERWDLVTMIYAGADPKLLARVQTSIKKGGLFVTEYFHKDSDFAKSGAGGWDPAQLEAAFKDGWKILRDDSVDDHADWAGQRISKLVRFVAQKL
jgi:SAM-dependent methyltransferase